MAHSFLDTISDQIHLASPTPQEPASPAPQVQVSPPSSSRIRLRKPWEEDITSCELKFGPVSTSKGLCGGSDEMYESPERTAVRSRPTHRNNTVERVTSNMDDISDESNSLSLDNNDGDEIHDEVYDLDFENFDVNAFLTEDLIEKDERWLKHMALGKATELTFEMATFIRECEYFVDENGNQIDSCVKALGDIDGFIESILHTTFQSLYKEGVREMETSRISTVIENYFRQLLTFQKFFEKETEIRRSCEIDEQYLTIELIDVDFVSTTGLKGSGRTKGKKSKSKKNNKRKKNEKLKKKSETKRKNERTFERCRTEEEKG